MSANAVDIGILGFGGFAMFAAQQFAQVPGAVLRCIAGTHREASLACAVTSLACSTFVIASPPRAHPRREKRA